MIQRIFLILLILISILSIKTAFAKNLTPQNPAPAKTILLADDTTKFNIPDFGTKKYFTTDLGEKNWVIGILKRIIDGLLEIAGALAVIAIVYSGIMYITSAGEQEKMEKAKKNLIWAIIALVIIALCLLIPTWISDILTKEAPTS